MRQGDANVRRVQPPGAELLLEIGSEELPAQFVTPALGELAAQATRLFAASRLRHGAMTTLGTPRRLALIVHGLATEQESIVTEVMGPSRAVAFDPDGKPTRAALGFAAGQGVPVESLESRTTPKGDYLVAVKRDWRAARPQRATIWSRSNGTQGKKPASYCLNCFSDSSKA